MGDNKEFKLSHHVQGLKQEFGGLLAPIQPKCISLVHQNLIYAKWFKSTILVREIQELFGVPKTIKGISIEGARDWILILVEQGAQDEVLKKLDKEKPCLESCLQPRPILE